MELREKVAQQIFAVCQEVFAQEEFAEGAVGRILAIPEIAEALAARTTDVAESLDECRAMDDEGARDLRRFNNPPA